MHATPARRRIARATVALGAVFLGMSLSAPSAQAGDAAGGTATLNAGNVGNTAAGKDGNEACPTPDGGTAADGLTAWHFIVDGQGEFVELTITFSIDGSSVQRTYTPIVVGPGDEPDWATFDPLTEAIAHPDAKHAYVYTGGDGTASLVAGTATVTGEATKFQLSHTCVGEGSTDGEDDPGDDGGEATTGGTGEVQATTGEQEPKPETEVLGNVVEPQQLPATGDNDRSLAIIGVALILIGGGTMLIRRDMLNRS